MQEQHKVAVYLTLWASLEVSLLECVIAEPPQLLEQWPPFEPVQETALGKTAPGSTQHAPEGEGSRLARFQQQKDDMLYAHMCTALRHV